PLGGGTADAMTAAARDGTLRVLHAAVTAGAKRVVMTSAANAASPSSYATEGVTDETLWTDPDDPALIPYRRSKTLAERAAGEFMWMAEMARVLRDGLGADGSRVSTRQVPDAVVRFAARFTDRSLREITPALGRRNRHTTEKARRVLGWSSRPARETVLDCA